MSRPPRDTSGFSLLGLLVVVAAVVTLAVGVEFVLRGLGIEIVQVRMPRSGVWALLVGVCCLGTGWFAFEGTSAMRRRKR